MRGENQRFQAPKLPTDFFFLLEENTVEEKAHVRARFWASWVRIRFGALGLIIFQVHILEAWPKMDRRVKGR